MFRSAALTKAIHAHLEVLEGVDAQARPPDANLELLLWEAGTAALTLPRFGQWLFSHPQALETLVYQKARGALRARVIAALTLNVAGDGFIQSVPNQDALRLSRLLRDLSSHPEALVWIPATRAMGRLAARCEDIKTLLFRWLDSKNLGERRRAICALGAMPGPESWWLETRVEDLFDHKDRWALASLGPAIPYLAVERREVWSALHARLMQEQDRPELLWSATQGLLCLVHRGALDRAGGELLAFARERAQNHTTRSVTEAQLWNDIERHTDFLDQLDPDPSDIDMQLRRAASTAVSVGAHKVAPRAIALARSLRSTFVDALTRAEEPDRDPSARAADLAIAESCVRAFALSLWTPMIAASDPPPKETALQEELEQTQLELFERTQKTLEGQKADYPLHRTALRLLGLLGDASARPGQSAVQLLRAIERPAWLRRPSKKDASRFQKPIADVLWRVVDATRPDKLEDIDRETLYARFAAWWALSAKESALLGFLPRSEAAARMRTSEAISDAVRTIQSALLDELAPMGRWAGPVASSLEALGAERTAIGRNILSLATALDQTSRAIRLGAHAPLSSALLALGETASALAPLISDPQQALDAPQFVPWPDEHYRELSAQTVELIGVSHLDDERLETFEKEWAGRLGPIVGPLVGLAVKRVLMVRRSASSPPVRKVGSYLLQRRLGRGTQGDVWLVEQERTHRRFVMKLLAKKSAAKKSELEQIKRALSMEADILKQLYHPNVANFVDNGWDREQPYLVLEYLVGCDLDAYAKAAPLSLQECKPIVQDVCSGLSALQAFGLVHCDLKPGNIFLRLGLPQGTAFAPEHHRDPKITSMLGAVVIDFGVARVSLNKEQSDTISGTLGYIAPEQADGIVHAKTDVYALAATIYRLLTGHTFFSDLSGTGPRLLAHHSQAPLDAVAVKRLGDPAPEALIELLREATALAPESRPDVGAFAERFAAL